MKQVDSVVVYMLYAFIFLFQWMEYLSTSTTWLLFESIERLFIHYTIYTSWINIRAGVMISDVVHWQWPVYFVFLFIAFFFLSFKLHRVNRSNNQWSIAYANTCADSSTKQPKDWVNIEKICPRKSKKKFNQ